MNGDIRVDPIRRHYNQWVSNEMLEDCALRFTALKSRRWSCMAVASTALGSISFLALEAIGAAITLQYGPANAISAILFVSFIIFLLGVPIAIHAAQAGIDIDLLTRGAGFGYLGSTVTSLIYAGFTFIYFALESAIMASALKVCFGVPLSIGYLLCSCVIIPVVIYGITMISAVQRFTQPIWIVLQIAPFVFLAWQSISPMPGWQGIGFTEFYEGHDFNLIMFGAASAVVFSLTVQIGEQVDYLRFLPPRSNANRKYWWMALLSAGPGWIVVGALKMLAGAYLGMLALQQGIARTDSIDPVYMYLNAWSAWLTPELALAMTGIFVIVCQFKINITNAYAGSIAWSNFFSRLTHSHPGRVVWLVFNVTIAWMLMELGVYQSLENTLSLYSILGVSWIGAIAADLAINKKLGISPPGVHFKRAQLYDINPVGVCSMVIATAAGLLAFSGVWGTLLQSLATYFSLVIAVLLMPIIGLLTKGKYYVVAASFEKTGIDQQTAINVTPTGGSTVKTCSLCRNDYDLEDMISCPAYQQTICSLCCSLDTRCEDKCRPNAQFLTQLRNWTVDCLPKNVQSRKHSTVLQFIGLLLVAGTALAFVFGLVYLQSELGDAKNTEHRITDLSSTVFGFLLNLFAALFVLTAIVIWIFLLTSESARRAREDTARQNQLLVTEIKAHKKTEMALSLAKEKAEAANLAKSRYVIGLSHELRTPLNSIQGYAQLMEQDTVSARLSSNGVRVIRDSARHLSGLIENLLDISKIEAGRLTINRDSVDLHLFLNQLVQMFQLQARNTHLDFQIAVSPHVPRMVYADEKRLRQILINLLSNAFKYTPKGHVSLAVEYRNQITTFLVSDTGVGICDSDLKRIYQPFETLAEANAKLTKGTGLGLTISKLLAEIMGGNLKASSTVGKGSCFTLKILLPPLENQTRLSGARQTFARTLKVPKRIVVVDDDANHRQLITDFLEPMGFTVDSYCDARSFLETSEYKYNDVYLLDISLPGMSGWELAEILKKQFLAPVRILMVSALADTEIDKHKHDTSIENYFVKPLDLHKLLFRIENILELEWHTKDTSTIMAGSADWNEADAVKDWQCVVSNDPANQMGNAIHTIPKALLQELINLGNIGHLTAINNLLEKILQAHPESADFIVASQKLLERHELEAFSRLLDSVGGHQNG